MQKRESETAPSTLMAKRSKMAFNKQVFDKKTSLLDNDAIPELLTTSYKTRPGPRANVSLRLLYVLVNALLRVLYGQVEAREAHVMMLRVLPQTVPTQCLNNYMCVYCCRNLRPVLIQNISALTAVSTYSPISPPSPSVCLSSDIS